MSASYAPCSFASGGATPLHDVVFYGASRFEAPEVGLKFRREQWVFEIKSVRGERSPYRDFAHAWKFIASCERITER